MQLELQHELQLLKQPVPLTVDFVLLPDTIVLVVYSDEVMQYPELERYMIDGYLRTLQQSIESYGWKSELEGRHGSSPG